MSSNPFVTHLSRYISPDAAEHCYQLLHKHPVKLKISKPRSTKLGDFRTAKRGDKHQISVNGNLNQHAFLVTLLHEIAHLKDYLERKTLKDAHGPNWKSIYASLLEDALENRLFPSELVPAINAHINSPKAASCSDPQLLQALRVYDPSRDTVLLETLDEASVFTTENGRRFKKGPLRRTRFRCLDLHSNRHYLVHKLTEVFPEKN